METTRGYAESASTSATTASEKATEASTSATKAKESETNASNSAKQAQTSANSIANVTSDVDKLKEDLGNKITKFYASNQGETHITDSDNGKIQDMMIYGKSSQNGTPTPDNPIEIQSVVNPKLEVCGKNLLPTTMFFNSTTTNGVSFTNNGDGSITVSGTAEMTSYFTLWGWNVLGDKGILPNLKIGDTIFSGDCIVKQTNSEKIISVTEGVTTVSFETTTMYVGIRVLKGETVNKTYYPYIVIGSTATDYEPYKEQTATLPYTLNAIPVTSGGNVTIDGQQYIADYVDIDKKQLVRMVENYKLTGSGIAGTLNKKSVYFINRKFLRPSTNSVIGAIRCNYFKENSWSNVIDKGVQGVCVISNTDYIGVTHDELTTVDEYKTFFNEHDVYVNYVLRTPTITDLTDEEVEAFKNLITYYPTTNISVNSEQLDGYTIFNYPISMQNGWNYVKQQLNDNRDYIYDMDMQSAEAYVNSEYAVALTELGV